MTSRYIPAAVRRLVTQRARGRCEYCLLHEWYTIQPHEVDHIHASKHGGQSIESNLCLCCFDCNRYKGSDIASLDGDEVVRLYHPRRDDWDQHFEVADDGLIKPRTPIANVTVTLLRINDDVRVEERASLLRLGRYP